jgi:phosphatidylglycerophosphatase GEP4
MTSYFNLSGTLNAFRVLRDPALCLPHATVSTFAQLPIPLSKAFRGQSEKDADIRAVVLDKDNCFAVPHANQIHEPFQVR